MCIRDRPSTVFRCCRMDYVTRQFINLVKRFRKELPKLAESVHRDLEQHARAICTTQERDEQQRNVQPIWLEPAISKYQESIACLLYTSDPASLSCILLFRMGASWSFVCVSGFFLAIDSLGNNQSVLCPPFLPPLES